MFFFYVKCHLIKTNSITFRTSLDYFPISISFRTVSAHYDLKRTKLSNDGLFISLNTNLYLTILKMYISIKISLKIRKKNFDYFSDNFKTIRIRNRYCQKYFRILLDHSSHNYRIRILFDYVSTNRTISSWVIK